MPESSWLQKLYPYRWQLLFLLLGILFVSLGIFIYKGDVLSQPSIEIVNSSNNNNSNDSANGKEDDKVVVVEISGSVNSPGVYELSQGSRIDDALKAANNITQEADKTWMEKFLNRAAMLVDGQKIYIPAAGEQLESPSANQQQGGVQGHSTSQNVINGIININTASKSELESLWGIGPVTAQSIIEQRIYSSVEELLSKGILKQNVYERNKDSLTVY
jgi:competence protein ComEA